MTTRYNALLVTLDAGIREDDLEVLISAVRQIRHVIDVTPTVPDSPDTFVIQRQISADLERKLWDVLHPKVH
jgi:hypothetical protein